MRGVVWLAAILPWAGSAAGAQEDPLTLVRRQSLRLLGPMSAWRAVDLDGDGPVELLTVDRLGRVQLRRSDPETGLFPEKVDGGVRLPHPQHSVLALFPRGEGQAAFDLLVSDPDGTRLHRIQPGAGLNPEPRPLAPRAIFRLRTGRPVFCDVVQDVNGDGAFDLVVPGGLGVELWMDERAQGGGFRRVARVPVRVRHRQSAGAELLSDVLSESLRVPRLSTEDVNGDGRDDLVVLDPRRRAFHMQGEAGGFPAEPDAVLELDIFRDTTPAASLSPGRTLVLEDEASVTSGDLNDDGIPDYVIAHRRKVWVFHGSTQGPQFVHPTSILKTPEDVTGLLLLHLDDDPYVDLLLYKVVVPSVAALVMGMFQTWDVEISARGYRSQGGDNFATEARDQGLVVLRLPPLMEILQRPEEILERLEQAESKFRPAASGDFDGDGTLDVALVSEDAQLLEVWRTPPDAVVAEETDDQWVRRLIFEQDDPVFGLERVLEYLSAFGERRTRRLTGDRAPDASLPLGEGSGLDLTAAVPADVDGDGRQELITAYEADGRLVVEVIELRRTPRPR